jgi:hypothetical protein
VAVSNRNPAILEFLPSGLGEMEVSCWVGLENPIRLYDYQLRCVDNVALRERGFMWYAALRFVLGFNFQGWLPIRSKIIGAYSQI